MTQDPRQDPRAGARRLSAYRGVVAIVLGMVVVVLYLSRGDDSWGPIILAGASFTLGAVLLFNAVRR
jgi:hypothetical protein